MFRISIFGFRIYCYNVIMYDPFGLSKNEQFRNPTTPVKSPKQYLWVIGGMVGVVLALAVGLYFIYKNSVSADEAAVSYTTDVQITGLSQELSPGDQFSITASLTNKSQKAIRRGYLLVSAQSADLSDTLALSKNLSSSEPGFLRRLNSDELSLFEKEASSGFYWYIGDLSADQTKSQQVKGQVSSGGNTQLTIEAKLYTASSATVSPTQIGFVSASAKISSSAKIALKSGYNFITLPYVFTTSAAQSFLNSLSTNWAYLYDATTAGYINLNEADNASKIKPGVGFWVKSNTEKAYVLPAPRVETSIDETFSLPLDIGWNSIGNPYAKRIKWSSTDILVHEVGDDGKETGIVYSLKAAIDNQTLSQASIVTYKNFTDSEGVTNDLASLISYSTLPLDSYLSPSVGVLISSTKKLNLVISGRALVAPGDLLADTEKKAIEVWISVNGLNQYGDAQESVYSAGNPLVNSTTGQPIDRYDYILLNHPERPWNK